ncbi:MAG TPA: helix-turn-helix domain-containing protein [Cyclobacteriaceae bacterium]|nr:helix-turn-helix domain-containing protein [Cyclobacteriaceae bacterium]
MEVITIESQAYKELLAQLQQIKSQLDSLKKMAPLEDTWLDNNEVVQLLKVSKRTLQTYRDDGKLSFSQVGSKIYYRSSDIDNFLKRHYKSAFKK